MDLVPQFWMNSEGWSDAPAGNVVRVADRDARTEGWEIRVRTADFDSLLLRLEARVGP